MNRPLRLLLVEDSEDDAELILERLRRDGHQLVHERVETAQAMESALDGEPWDVIIADYTLPSFSGLAALALMQERGLDLAFILVSGSVGEDVAVAAMKAGAHDYVMKGNLARLSPALRRELADAVVRRERRLMKQRMQHDALHDAATGLPNRGLFLDRLALAVARSERHEGYRFGVLAVAVEGLDVVIGSLGHGGADALLVRIARALETCIAPGDTVARLSGDEFAVLLDDIPALGTPLEAAARIGERVGQPCDVEGHDVFVTASIGVVLGGASEYRAEDLLRDATTAMHRARRLGKGRTEIFDKGMHAQAVSVMRLQSELRRALERSEFRLAYQPIVSLETGRLAGFEALARWQHPQRGLLPPEEFIPGSEDNGLIVPIGEWILRTACEQVSDWNRRRNGSPPVAVSVNVSGVQFRQRELERHVAEALREVALDPTLLHLEITESVLMADAGTSTDTLRRLKELGVQLNVDDFGTGYSSLRYLHRFPIDTLKIDQSFVRTVPETDEGKRIVRTIIVLAHDMGLDVVAEGVETAEQRTYLEGLQCERAQGFLFSGPVDTTRAGALVASTTQW